jgi:hypothetical protein
MGVAKKHFWAVFSTATSCLAFVVPNTLEYFLSKRGTWRADATLSQTLDGISIVLIAVSIVAAIVALVRERPFIYGLLALVLGLFFLIAISASA